MSSAVRIAVLANASQAKAELASVESRGARAGRSLAKIGKVAGVGVLALAVGLGASAKAAAADEAAQSRLAQTYRTAAKATSAQIAASEKWITVQGRQFGVADDELRPALGRLAAATGSVSKAQKLAALGMNVAAGTGKSLETVTTALAKAQTGSLGGLSRLGIRTKDASGKTLSLAKVTQQLADKYRGAASKAADTTAGKQKKLTVQMGELQEQIGAGLLPVMVKLSTLGLKIVDYTSRHGKAVTIVIAVLGTLALVTYAASKAIAVYNAVQKLQALNTKRVAAGQKALNLTMLANPVVLIVAGIILLVAGLVLLYKRSDKARAIMDKVWASLKQVGEFIARVLLGYLRTLANLWLTMGIVAIGALKALLKAAFIVFDGILKAAAKGLGWIPGIGGKIKSAEKAFHEFGTGTIGVLDAVQGKLVNARDKVNDLGRAKAKPTIDTSSIDHANTRLDRLIANLNKASGGLLGPILTFGGTPRTTAPRTSPSATPPRSAQRTTAQSVAITVQVPPTVNTAEVGRVTVDAIREFYAAGGAKL